MSNRHTVGLSQRIQLDWLERTALLYISGASRQEIQRELEAFLQDKVSIGSRSKGQTNRRKTISNLLRIWVSPPAGLECFRDAGINHIKQLPYQDHVIVHWGMTMAAYPFFYTVVETVGRLLFLQGMVTSAQVHRRMKEQLGERSTVERATRRAISTLNNWNILQSTKEIGVYQATPDLLIDNLDLTTWLIEATLIASNADCSPLHTITNKPALFPFNINQKRIVCSEKSRLEIVQQGLNQSIVLLR